MGKPVARILEVLSFLWSNIFVDILRFHWDCKTVSKLVKELESKFKNTTDEGLEKNISMWSKKGGALTKILPEVDEMLFGIVSSDGTLTLLLVASLITTMSLAILIIKFRFSKPLRL